MREANAENQQRIDAATSFSAFRGSVALIINMWMRVKTAIINLVPETGTIPKYEVVAAATATRISRDDVRDYIKILLREKRLFEHGVREGKGRSEVHLSRQDEPCQEGATHQAVEHEETAV